MKHICLITAEKKVFGSKKKKERKKIEFHGYDNKSDITQLFKLLRNVYKCFSNKIWCPIYMLEFLKLETVLKRYYR